MQPGPARPPSPGFAPPQRTMLRAASPGGGDGGRSLLRPYAAPQAHDGADEQPMLPAPSAFAARRAAMLEQLAREDPEAQQREQ